MSVSALMIDDSPKMKITQEEECMPPRISKATRMIQEWWQTLIIIITITVSI